MDTFTPKICVLENGRFKKGLHFLYVDIIDDGRLIHSDIFDKAGINVKVESVMENDDFVANGYGVAFVIARAKCSSDALCKAVSAIAEDVANLSTDLYDLYKDAHAVDFFN